MGSPSPTLRPRPTSKVILPPGVCSPLAPLLHVSDVPTLVLMLEATCCMQWKDKKLCIIRCQKGEVCTQQQPQVVHTEKRCDTCALRRGMNALLLSRQNAETLSLVPP